MPFDLPVDLNLTFNAAFAKTAFYISLTILIAVIVDNVLRALIKIPKHFDTRRARSLAAISRNIITVIVYSIAVYTILTTLGINLVPLLASASIIGVIIGIGARSIIEDFLNGFFLLSLNSITVGDYVKIDDDPKDQFISEGIVERIGVRIISIRSSLDGTLYLIPNGKIKKIVNYSRPRASTLIDIPLKTEQHIEPVLKAANDAITKLQKDENLGKFIFAGSEVSGIEKFESFGFMVLRINIYTSPTHRLEISRHYRYLFKKEAEKNKLKFG